MEEIDKLNKKVDRLEYTEIAGIKEKINNIELELVHNSAITQQNSEAMHKMSDTLDRVSDTMVKLSESINQNNMTTTMLKSTTDDLKDNIEDIQSKIDSIEEKSKFDILFFLKSKWVEILMACGIIGYLYLK